MWNNFIHSRSIGVLLSLSLCHYKLFACFLDFFAPTISFLRWMACEKIVIFFNFIKIAKHTYSYAKFIVNSISENRFYLS